MPAILYVKNTTNQVFHFPILKFGSVQFNPDQIRTFPVQDLSKNYENFLKHQINVNGEKTPAFIYGFYDPNLVKFIEVERFLNGEITKDQLNGKVPTKRGPLELLDAGELVSWDDLTSVDEIVLRRMCYKLGSSPSNMKGRPGLSEDIMTIMEEWKSIAQDQRSTLNDEEVDYLMKEAGW